MIKMFLSNGLCIPFIRYQVRLINCNSIILHRSFASSETNAGAENELDSDKDVLELEKKRNKCGIRDPLYTSRILKKMKPLVCKFNHDMRYIRKMYAIYGKETGLNPGIMWPTREEVKEKIEIEKKYFPTFQEMIANVQKKRQEEADQIRLREHTIEKNMAKNEQWIKEFQQKQSVKDKVDEAQKIKQQNLVEEVHEYLGYTIDPRHAKFQEALEMKEAEKKKMEKELKKKRKYEEMLERLTGVVRTPEDTKKDDSSKS